MRSTVAKNTGFALLLVFAVNALIQLDIGISGSGTRGGGTIGPVPGWFIGLVWTGLFAGLGLVRGLVETDRSASGGRASRAILVLLVACAIYPFYTFGLRSDVIGLAGNIATIGLSLWVAARVGRVRRLAVASPLAVVAWLLFASATLIDQNHWLNQ